MYDMYRGTTPTVRVKLDYDHAVINLGDAERIWVTLRNMFTELTVDETRLAINEETGELTFTLTQEETLGFLCESDIKVQLRMLIYTRAYATNIATVKMKDILKDGVIT